MMMTVNERTREVEVCGDGQTRVREASGGSIREWETKRILRDSFLFSPPRVFVVFATLRFENRERLVLHLTKEF
jgi:hypothetical protein